MRITYAIEISAPIEKAFECVSDDEKAKKWIAGLVSVKYLTQRKKKNPVGAKFRRRFEVRGRTIEWEGEIIEYEKPRLMGLRFTVGGFSVEEYYRFEPVQNGTRFNFESNYTFATPLSRLRRYFFARSAKRNIATQIRNLKAFAEHLESEEARKSGRFDVRQEPNLDSLQAFLDFYFPDRVKSIEETRRLVDEISKHKVSIRQLVDSFEQAKELLPLMESEGFGPQRGRWAQAGIFRTMLHVTNDDYWQDRKSILPEDVQELTQKWRARLKSSPLLWHHKNRQNLET